MNSRDVQTRWLESQLNPSVSDIRILRSRVDRVGRQNTRLVMEISDLRGEIESLKQTVSRCEAIIDMLVAIVRLT